MNLSIKCILQLLVGAYFHPNVLSPGVILRLLLIIPPLQVWYCQVGTIHCRSWRLDVNESACRHVHEINNMVLLLRLYFPSVLGELQQTNFSHEQE